MNQSYLGVVDTALLERAVVGILGTHVAILAPVAWEGAIHARKAAKMEREIKGDRKLTGVT